MGKRSVPRYRLKNYIQLKPGFGKRGESGVVSLGGMQISVDKDRLVLDEQGQKKKRKIINSITLG
jgi:hypothetical protein